MKKLLLVAGILAIYGMTFAATTNSEGTGTLDVKAEVVTQLQRIAAGQENKPEEKAGSFTIVGTSGKNIKVTVRDEITKGEYINPTNGINVTLYQNGTPSTITNKKMISKLFLYNSSTQVTDSPITFGTKADYFPNPNREQPKTKLTLDVRGSLTAGINQDVGNYNGILGVKAVYTDPVLNK